MKADPKVLKHLNDAVRAELTAINQYLLHAHLLDDWGFSKLSAKMREEMTEELGHADKLIQRILFLEGTPDTGKLNKVEAAKSVRNLFEHDLKAEREAVASYSRAASDAEAANDYVTRDLFVELIRDEEGHVDWLDTQLDLIQRIGEQAYLQLHI